MKNNKGITLIALVITIIVLLILAGVAIAMLTGDNGILTRASDSKAANAVGTAKDEIALKVAETVSDYYDEIYVTGNGTTAYDPAALKTKITTAISGVTVAGVDITASDTEITVQSKEKSNIKSVGTYTEKGAISWTDTFKTTN